MSARPSSPRKPGDAKASPGSQSLERGLDVLEIVDGLLLGFVVDELNEGETALAARFAVEGKAALADFAVLAEEIKQILAFGLEREVADVNGHSLKSLELIRLMLGYPGEASER